MTLQDRIDSLVALQQNWDTIDWNTLFERAQSSNPWFTKENQQFALEQWKIEYLNKNILENWVEKYSITSNEPTFNIGLVLAGNIPLVGLHDVITTYLAGHKALIKYSEKDNVLIPALLAKLTELVPEAKNYFEEVDRLKNYQAVIATGSNNSAAQFSYYFRNVPHIIRHNRNSIAILDGNEDINELERLASDIFLYFGLGCRNVSKIFIPEGYKFDNLFASFDKWSYLAFHHKYKNNLEYNHALYLLNKTTFFQHDSIFLLESEHIASRVGSLHFEFYNHIGKVKDQIAAKKDEIQCVVQNHNWVEGLECFGFGEAQKPTIDTYADNVDTLEFLTSLSF